MPNDTAVCFKKNGRYQLLCAVHPEMEAFVLVVDNPYFAVTEADGKFRIDGVPPGTYTLRAWSEKLPETTQTVTVTSGATTTVQFDLKKK